MSLGDLWSRTLVYFGIAEEDDDFYEAEETFAAEESLEQSYRERPNVRRLTPRRRSQQIADRFKQSIPVILNLQNADAELSKRLIDFASGLTYALNGGMQRVADKVFLLTPRNVEVSAEQRAQLLERGGFYNQA